MSRKRLYFSAYLSFPLLSREWRLVQLFIVLYAARWTAWICIHTDGWMYGLSQHQKSLNDFEKELGKFMKIIYEEIARCTPIAKLQPATPRLLHGTGGRFVTVSPQQFAISAARGCFRGRVSRANTAPSFCGDIPPWLNQQKHHVSRCALAVTALWLR